MDENVVPLRPDSGPEGEPAWTRSSLSTSGESGVAVTGLPNGEVGVRVGKGKDEEMLRFTRDEWVAFIGGVRGGEFDRFGA